MECSRQVLKFFQTQLRQRIKVLRYMATVRNPKNHYDSLGLSPKATQGEIKTAYYKLSMIYHPDKNKDEASLQKFRDITQAYEVLGNNKSRKLYDRGLYIRPRTTTTTTTHDDKPVDRFYKSREVRSRPPPPSGQTPIYDFDEWAKNHYGESFQRKMENKRRAEEYRYSRQTELGNKKMERVVFAVTSFIIICMLFSGEKSYDIVNVAHLGNYVVPKDNNNSNDKNNK